MINVNKFETILRGLLRVRALPSDKYIYKILGETKITVADIGATGNPKGLWMEAQKYSNFLLFDPHPNAEMSKQKNTTIFQKGLYSNKIKKKLYLASNPEASSLYEFNDIFTEIYLNSYLHKTINIIEIELESLDYLISKSSDVKPPDFIKIDAEGAELEILKGGNEVIKNSCLGVFLEVSFRNRHKNAPLFNEIDTFLTQNNFVIFDIYPERWANKNKITSGFSRHQIVWGDAIYFISTEEYIKRIKLLDKDKRIELASKFIFLLVLYQFHDYAYYIAEISEELNLIEDSNKLKHFIESSMENPIKKLIKLFIQIIICAVFNFLLIPFKKLHYKNKILLKIQFGEFLFFMNQFSSKRYTGCVVDTSNPGSRI
jgi:FkbM family methyltransferase